MKQHAASGQTPSAQWSAFQAGDPQALSALFVEHYEPLFHYGRRLTAEDALVEDCIQEIFAELWQNRRNLTVSVQAVRFYLLTSLRRRILRQRRVRERKSAPDLLRQHYAEDHTPSYEARCVEADALAARSHLLHGCLNALPRRQREAMFLRYFESLSYVEIAELMGCQVQSVRNLIHQALLRLRQSPALQQLATVLTTIVAIAATVAEYILPG